VKSTSIAPAMGIPMEEGIPMGEVERSYFTGVAFICF